MVKVVDNLLSPEEFKKLNDVLMGPEFPWYFLPSKVHSGDGNFQFCHNFILLENCFFFLLIRIATKLQK